MKIQVIGSFFWARAFRALLSTIRKSRLNQKTFIIKIEHNLFKSFMYNEFLTISRHHVLVCPVLAGLPLYQPRQPCSSCLSRIIWIHVMSTSTDVSRVICRERTSFGYVSQQAGGPFIDVRALLCIVYGTAKPYSWTGRVDTCLVARSLHIPTYIFVIF